MQPIHFDPGTRQLNLQKNIAKRDSAYKIVNYRYFQIINKIFFCREGSPKIFGVAPDMAKR